MENTDKKELYEKEIRNKLEETILTELEKSHNVKDANERLVKQDYLFNVFKILKYYKELTPTLKQFFAEQYRKEKFQANESWDSISK